MPVGGRLLKGSAQKMTKKLNKKSVLIFASVMLVIMIAALVGTTLAYFTDSASSGVNKIVSGTLDVGMNYWDEDEGEFLDATNATLFDPDALWEPGYMDIAYIEIENRGSLSFNYLFVVYPAEEVLGYHTDGTTFYISDYLVYAIVKYDVEASGVIADRETALDLISNVGMGVSTEQMFDGTMTPDDESVRLAMVVYMPTTVTSEQANHDVYSGKPAPKVRLAVDVYATQLTFEKDSFSHLYDSGLTPSWTVPIWRYAPDGYVVDQDNKTITVNTAEALKYLGKIYDDMLIHPNYEPDEWEIILGDDIDFGGEVLTEPLRFGGFKSFDGNNKTITNVVLNYIYVDEEVVSVGLFDELPSTKDLTLTNVVVKSETTAAGVLAGSLVGDSYSNITVSDSSATGIGFIGGMIGYWDLLHPIDFSGCRLFRVDLSLFSLSNFGSAGGIAGYAGGNGSLNVTDTTVDGLNAEGVAASGSYVGGMFGELEADAEISLSTITEITIYRDVYIGAVTGKIYSTKDVKLVNNTVSVVVTEDGVETVVPFVASGDVEEEGTEVDWEAIESVTGALKTTYGGHFYEVFVTTSDITWVAAKDSCISKNGHLVTITSAEENTAVVTIVNRFANSAWLGAYRTHCYGHYTGPHNFAWVTGEEWVYSNWASGEPNDSHTHQGRCEDSLHMYSSGQWNDYQNNHTNMRGYVCEWDSLQSYLNYLSQTNN